MKKAEGAAGGGGLEFAAAALGFVELVDGDPFAQPELAGFGEVDAGAVGGDRAALGGQFGAGGDVDQLQLAFCVLIEVGFGRVAAFGARHFARVGGQRRAGGEDEVAQVGAGAGEGEVEFRPRGRVRSRWSSVSTAVKLPSSLSRR